MAQGGAKHSQWLPVSSFIASLPPEDLNSLYRDGAASAVLFVFRQLEPLAQLLISRLLLCGKHPFQEALLRTWAAPADANVLASALDSLGCLRILEAAGTEQAEAPPGRKALRLNVHFQTQLAAQLLTGAQPGAALEAGGDEVAGEPAAQELHAHAFRRWEALLQHLAAGHAPAPVAHGISQELRSIVARLQLLDAGSQLTSQGFRFILDARQQQLWALVLPLLEQARPSGGHLLLLGIVLDLAEALVGQRLRLLEEGAATSTAALSLAKLLLEVGAVQATEAAGRGPEPSAYYATPALLAMFRSDVSLALSRNLSGFDERFRLPAQFYVPRCRSCWPEHTDGPLLADEQQGIIVESNFKVYAYTTSSLHVQLLGLFCQIVLTMPNLVVGLISAEVVLEAMQRGIQAGNILRYLESAAHPRAIQRLDQGGTIVPANVQAQLEVWESTRTRMDSVQQLRDSLQQRRRTAAAAGPR